MSQENTETNSLEVDQPQTRREIEAQIIAQAWRDEAYKQELLANPKDVLEREIGIEFDEEVNVKVWEENSTSLYFVLPIRPEIKNNELSEQELETVAGGIIGGALLAADLALTTYTVFGQKEDKKKNPSGGSTTKPKDIGKNIRKKYHD